MLLMKFFNLITSPNKISESKTQQVILNLIKKTLDALKQINKTHT